MQADVVIIGAGAAGLMCAIEAGKRGRKVIVLEKSNKVGKKILMSGGGRCNFTNLDVKPERYLSHNRHFHKSALSRYTQFDFIDLVKKHQIPYYEKTLGQLFCKHKAKDIVTMLLKECGPNVEIKLNQSITKIAHHGKFSIKTENSEILCESLVIATGGLSIPTLGSSPFGYQIAEQFGHPIMPLSAALVPFTLHKHDLERFVPGVSHPCRVTVGKTSFDESLLFTHRGVSGPVMLQISSYWQPGQSLSINFFPKLDVLDLLKKQKQATPKALVKSLFDMPASLMDSLLAEDAQLKLGSCANTLLESIAKRLSAYPLSPNATEGYRTAEVTKGGVDCNTLCSKTMMSKLQDNLYFVGEVVDVTGWLGGYNFQWAWSSGWAAGQVV